MYSGDTDHVERAKFRFADHALAGMTLNSPVVNNFIEWCKSSFLNFNVATKICIDFGKKNSSVFSPVLMGNQAVELVQQ